MNRQLLGRFGALLTGTSAAQVLPIVTAPVIARNYDMAEFGVFGFFLASLAIVTTIANLKYDTAILAVRSKREVRAILGLGLTINLLIGALISLAITLAVMFSILPWLNPSPAIIVILPISFILAGGLQALCTTALRGEYFAAVARSRFIAAATSAALSLIAALMHPTSEALMLSSVSGQLAGIASLLATKKLRENVSLDLRLARMWLVARKYWRFAVFTSPADMLNALAFNLPALLLGVLYGTAATGAFVLAQRVVGTPLMLIGSAFSDLYRQKIGQRSTSNTPYWDVTIRVLVPLVMIGFLTLMAVLIFGDAAIRIFLGVQWNLVAEILQIMIIVYVVRFIASPLTYTYYLAEKHSEDLALQFCSAIAGLAFYVIAQSHSWTLSQYLTTIAGSLSFIYLIYGARSLMLAKASETSAPRR